MHPGRDVLSFIVGKGPAGGPGAYEKGNTMANDTKRWHVAVERQDGGCFNVVARFRERADAVREVARLTAQGKNARLINRWDLY